MASLDSLSNVDKEFLYACEELLKDRYTENDEEFMKVYKAEASKPPIVDSWRVPNNSGWRNAWRGRRRGDDHHHRGHGGRHQDTRRAQHSGGRPHPYQRSYY